MLLTCYTKQKQEQKFWYKIHVRVNLYSAGSLIPYIKLFFVHFKILPFFFLFFFFSKKSRSTFHFGGRWIRAWIFNPLFYFFKIPVRGVCV
jgi:hypothetical protein